MSDRISGPDVGICIVHFGPLYFSITFHTLRNYATADIKVRM